jgi:hypothetical protein
VTAWDAPAAVGIRSAVIIVGLHAEGIGLPVVAGDDLDGGGGGGQLLEGQPLQRAGGRESFRDLGQGRVHEQEKAEYDAS